MMSGMTQPPTPPSQNPYDGQTPGPRTNIRAGRPEHTMQLPTPPPSYRPSPPAPPAPPAPRRSGLGAGVLVGALVIGGLAGVGGAVGYEKLAGSDDTTVKTEDGGTIDTSQLNPLDIVSVNSVAKAVLPSVVKITAALDNGSGGTGSGSILTEDGEILTNNHVVEIADTEGATLTVSFNDGTNAEAELIGRDPATDLALIKVTDKSDLPPIQIGDSDATEVGQAVVAVGSPYGLEATVTAGIVSALHRPLVLPLESDPNQASVYGAIQTDASINPGNSGGALVNMAGQQIGVNSVIQLARGADGGTGDSGNVGIGYAIPISDAMPIIEQLRAGETPTHARLGVAGEDAEFGPLVSGGADVTEVEEGSPAADAGIEAGDVITSIGDVHVGSWYGLLAAVYSFRPDESADVVLIRDGEEQTVNVTFGSDAE